MSCGLYNKEATQEEKKRFGSGALRPTFIGMNERYLISLYSIRSYHDCIKRIV